MDTDCDQKQQCVPQSPHTESELICKTHNKTKGAFVRHRASIKTPRNMKQNTALSQAQRPASHPALFSPCCRYNMIQKYKKRHTCYHNTAPGQHLKQSASFTPATLPGSMMRLRRGWNKWRLRGRALTSERLRYFGPAPYSGDGAEL